ncbi:MAG: FtsW/RodA/SpoVE family cell cycle protein [Acidimicrobiales bacterium]
MTDTLSAITSHIRRQDRMDYGLLWGLIALGVTGVVMIYSATRQALVNAGESPHYFVERQAFFVIVGFAVMYAVSRIDYRKYEMVATPLYVLSLFALAGVFVVGKFTLGAERWYSFGSVQIQPSEFAVLCLIIAVATFCARRTEGLKMYDVMRLLLMAAVPLALILKQPDLGTSIIIVLVVSAMMVIAGVPPRFMTMLAVIGSLGLAAAVYLDLLEKYQVDRFTAFLHQNSTNPAFQTLIYNVNNAKSAIGAGGLHGAGLFHGLQTILGYVPEQQTDFIFTAIGEQVGFIGSVVVILLLAFVGYRIFVIGKNARDTMGRLICIGVFIFFAFSAFENIGMTMGIMPVTGVPLPLLSYGGSAAVCFLIAGGMVLSVSRRGPARVAP